jgi:mono/diheme cytochrome c family protein
MHLDRRIAQLIRYSALAGCLLAPGNSGLAREDTPPEVAGRPNPETIDAREMRYYARLFKANCARCHGPDGAGRGTDATNQPLPPRDLTDIAYMSTRTDGQLFYQILMGGQGESSMPAFGPTSASGWSESKIWHMVAFVRRLGESADRPNRFRRALPLTTPGHGTPRR